MERVAPEPPRVSDIVAEAGSSNKAFYRYFAGKDDVILAVMERGVAIVVSYLQHQMAKEPTPAAQVQRWIEGALAQVADPHLISMSRAAAGQVSATANWRAADDEIMRPMRDLLTEPVAALGSNDVRARRRRRLPLHDDSHAPLPGFGAAARPRRRRSSGAVLSTRTGGQLMRAVVCRAYGPPEDLVVDDVADPTPGPGQLVVRVHAAAVNFPDVLLIAGKYQVKIPMPFTPGSELAGEVIAAGEGAPFAAGRTGFGATPTGAFAELALLACAAAVTEIPDGADFASAAAFGVTYRTAYHALRSVADVAPGDWVVDPRGRRRCGFGRAWTWRSAMKARVLAAASSPRRSSSMCRQRGAEATVDYDREDLKIGIRELTGDAARVVLDPGRRAVTRSRRCAVLPAAGPSSPSVTPRARSRHPAESGSAQRTSPFGAWRFARSSPTSPDDAARDMRELTADVRRRPDPALHRRPVRIGPTPRRRYGMSPTARRSARWSSTSA